MCIMHDRAIFEANIGSGYLHLTLFNIFEHVRTSNNVLCYCTKLLSLLVKARTKLYVCEKGYPFSNAQIFLLLSQFRIVNVSFLSIPILTVECVPLFGCAFCTHSHRRFTSLRQRKEKTQFQYLFRLNSNILSYANS